MEIAQPTIAPVFSSATPQPRGWRRRGQGCSSGNGEQLSLAASTCQLSRRTLLMPTPRTPAQSMRRVLLSKSCSFILSSLDSAEGHQFVDVIGQSPIDFRRPCSINPRVIHPIRSYAFPLPRNPQPLASHADAGNHRPPSSSSASNPLPVMSHLPACRHLSWYERRVTRPFLSSFPR